MSRQNSAFPEHEADSKVVHVPETMCAACPVHGIIASITIEPADSPLQGRHWEVRCYKCGAPCALEMTA